MSVETEVKRQLKIRKPKKFCNIFYNNDKTPFDVVIYILINVFNYTPHNAVEKAKEIHQNGESNIFISTKATCETKKKLVDYERSKVGERFLVHSVELYDDEQ